jgi:hypothetical protein
MITNKELEREVEMNQIAKIVINAKTRAICFSMFNSEEFMFPLRIPQRTGLFQLFPSLTW